MHACKDLQEEQQPDFECGRHAPLCCVLWAETAAQIDTCNRADTIGRAIYCYGQIDGVDTAASGNTVQPVG